MPLESTVRALTEEISVVENAPGAAPFGRNSCTMPETSTKSPTATPAGALPVKTKTASEVAASPSEVALCR